MNIIRSITRGLLVVALISMLTLMAYAQEDCSILIPKQGAFQLFTDNGEKKVFNTAKEFYCSDEWTKSAQKSGWNFDTSATGYGSAAGGGSNSSSFASRAAFCSDKNVDFSSSDKTALYRLQGDQVLVGGFVECIRLKTTSVTQVFSVSGESVGDDVTITIKPNLSQNAVERIVTVSILSGATSKEGVGIAPGTPMIGKSEVVGGYTLTAPQATFIIKTSTGDQRLVVKRCRKGTSAGSFEVKATTFTTELQSVGVKRWSFNAPQAGCHPRCKLVDPPNPEGGDVHLHHVKDEAILKNPRYECEGGGCPWQDRIEARLIDDHQIRFTFRARTIPTTMHLLADAFVEKKIGHEKTLKAGEITWGKPFSIQIPSDATGAYLVYEGTILPLDSLTDGAPFKIIAAKVQAGNNLVWTLRLDDPTCP